MTEGSGTLRADARRNRAQILGAAKMIFAQQGPDVPMEQIARGADVGVGTLYRRFPDRESLIRAVARDNFSTALDGARAAVENEPTAWQALVRFLGLSFELRLSVQLAMVSPAAHAVLAEDATTRGFREELVTLLDEVVRAAQQEGSLREDIGTGDITMLIVMLIKSQRQAWGDVTDMAVQRCVGVMLDGLRAQPGGALPGRPLTVEDVVPHS